MILQPVTGCWAVQVDIYNIKLLPKPDMETNYIIFYTNTFIMCNYWQVTKKWQYSFNAKKQDTTVYVHMEMFLPALWKYGKLSLVSIIYDNSFSYD